MSPEAEATVPVPDSGVADETAVDVDMMTAFEGLSVSTPPTFHDAPMADIGLGEAPHAELVAATQEVEMAGGDDFVVAPEKAPEVPDFPLELLEEDDWELGMGPEEQALVDFLLPAVNEAPGDGTVIDPSPQQQQQFPLVEDQQLQQQPPLLPAPDALPALPVDSLDPCLPMLSEEADANILTAEDLDAWLEQELDAQMPVTESVPEPATIDPALLQLGETPAPVQSAETEEKGESSQQQGEQVPFTFSLTSQTVFNRKTLKPRLTRPAEGFHGTIPLPVGEPTQPPAPPVVPAQAAEPEKPSSSESRDDSEKGKKQQSAEQIAARPKLVPRSRRMAAAPTGEAPSSRPTDNTQTNDATTAPSDLESIPIDPQLFEVSIQGQQQQQQETPSLEEEEDLYGDDRLQVAATETSGQSSQQQRIPAVNVGGFWFPGGNTVEAAPVQGAEAPQHPVEEPIPQGPGQQPPVTPRQQVGRALAAPTPTGLPSGLPTHRTKKPRTSLFRKPQRAAPTSSPTTPRTADGGSADRERAVRSQQTLEENLRRREFGLPALGQSPTPSRGLTMIPMRQAQGIIDAQAREKEAAGQQVDEE